MEIFDSAGYDLLKEKLDSDLISMNHGFYDHDEDRRGAILSRVSYRSRA